MNVRKMKKKGGKSEMRWGISSNNIALTRLMM